MDRSNREEGRQTLPFEGLHVYQRTQEAWESATGSGADPLWVLLESEARAAAIGIARATARSRADGGFAAELALARGAVHAASAIADQLERRGDEVDEALRTRLVDSSRMLGALIRSVSQPRDETAEEVAAL